MFRKLLTCIVFFNLSCSENDNIEKKEPLHTREVRVVEDVCKLAQQHISECLSIEETPLGDCDENSASELLLMSCDEIQEGMIEQKEDGTSWLDKLHCNIGVLHFCSVNICEEESLQPSSSCLDALSLNKCGQCSYYECLEEKAQCGDSGYILDFVGKYCNRFTQVTYPKLSEFGKVWLEGVRECLIYNMESKYYEGESCESIEDRGIEDHIECYVNTGICSLPVNDMLKIIGTISPKELPFKQMISVGNKCLEAILPF